MDNKLNNRVLKMEISRDLKIEIRPIPGRDGIKKFSENLEYFSQAHTIHAFVDPNTMRYATGLSKKDKEYLKDSEFPYDISDSYKRGVVHPFWENDIAKVSLKNTPDFLFPGRSDLDFVKWKYMLVNSFVYNSEAEMLSGTKPQATHYIYNQSEETALKASKLQKTNDLIRKTSELSLKRKRDMVLIIEGEVTENKDEDYLTVKFDQIIKNTKKAALLRTLINKSAEDVTLTADIKSALQKNVLRKTKQGIFFFEINLGFGEDDVKEFLSKDENQEIFINIKSKIE